MSALQIIISAILAVLVLAGISMMSKVRTAVAGNLLSAFAMLCGIVGTLFFAGVVSVWTIYVSILIGALIGSLLAARVPMIQMPPTGAPFHGLGGGASALVGLLSVHGDSAFVRFTALLAVAVGMVTLVGSLIAAGKLHRVLPQKPVVWKGHALCTLLFLVLTLAFVVAGTFAHGACLTVCLVGAFVSASLFGLWFSLRVGGADMPITISLLNSLSGVAGSIAGMAIGDVFLVAVGGIVGASGLLLTQIMCRAMNRKLMSILTGGTMKPSTPTPAIEENENEELVQRIMDLEKKIKELEAMVADLEARVQALDGQLNAAPAPAPVAAPVEEAPTAASVLSKATDVIIVPGYGMALAQAQHQVRQLADKLESRGARVRFAIHPVAGRMPGHMNVLLAEADVDYEKLYEMDAINDDFKNADAVVVIGANDVLTPAARNAVGTPIYGMPVLNVDQAPEVIVCNFDLKPGYAGVENPIYSREKGVYLELGDAKETLMRLMAGIA